MRIKPTFLALFVSLGTAALMSFLYLKDNRPVLRANSDLVDIRDGNMFFKSAWIISPENIYRDYTTSIKNSKVTIYTDLDSISFTVKPNEKYEFIVLINGKDRVYGEVHYSPGFLELLKKAAKYNDNDNREVPKFTYQSAENIHLQSLRKHFNLDSIAGNGDEFSRVLNLLHWLHNLIPHDGQNGNPEIRNAESMISVCKKEGRGLNCRGLAITLNECYLSIGFKSRFVTCLPKDSLGKDRDCHVINSVYLNSMNKWIWVDPTFNAYVMDEKGSPLSIEEVRERIIKDEPLVINSDANWNNKRPAVKEDYLFRYMAKNLYTLVCPAASEYDLETFNKDKYPGGEINYIKLVPLDYHKQEPNKKGNSYFHITNNSKAFWEKP